MNWTWPGKAHVILSRQQIYVSVWLWSWRVHAHAHRRNSIEAKGWS